MYDIKIAPELILGLDLKETQVVCADKGYDSEPLRELIKQTGTKEKIANKKSRIVSQITIIWTGIYIKVSI
ncbi:hypothetical protein F944_01265 [Acinetobacter ursingii DSM 16037 = CIP 107286]|nr:hypothetical protein F944_01265 [Acinetobacter ursingii DSM 16037 = CIP 107286]